jgi:hypothetical protein
MGVMKLGMILLVFLCLISYKSIQIQMMKYVAKVK